jgi:hypothetical protein
MGAVVTFRRCRCLRIDIESVVGTSLHTGFTTDTSLSVEINDAVFTLPEGSNRTNVCTGRIITMVTSHHRKIPLCIREFALFDILNPCFVDSNWIIVFGFTRNRARVTTDAFSIIDDKAVISNNISPGFDCDW